MSKNYSELLEHYANMIDGNDKTITVLVPSKPNADAVLGFLLLEATFYDAKNPDREVIFCSTTDDYMTKEALEKAGTTEACLLGLFDKAGAIICGFTGYEYLDYSFDLKDIINMVFYGQEVDVDRLTSSLRDLFGDMQVEAWNTPEFSDYLDSKEEKFAEILNKYVA